MALRAICGVVYVAVDGSDSTGDGSQTNPYATLARTFTFIRANPLAGGYAVMLPGCPWEENVTIPPPGTQLVGQGPGSRLSAPGNTPLTWAEPAAPATGGTLRFRDLTLNANVTGRDGGNLNLVFDRCAVVGTLTLLGRVVFNSCTAYPALVNIAALSITDTQAGKVALAWSTLNNVATNGSGPPGHFVDGGDWLTIRYTSDTPAIEALLQCLRATNVIAVNGAVIRVQASRAPTLTSTDPSCLIEFDRPIQRQLACLGAGMFRLAEWVCDESILAGFVDSQVTVCVPRHEPGTKFDRIFATFSEPGFTYSYVSNTDADIHVRIVPPPGFVAAFTAHFSIKPRS
jgi:hypothetical protein